MWISKMISRQNSRETAESGIVTMTDGGKIEASASVNEREISAFLPYGFSSVPPSEEEVMLVPCSNGSAVIGVKQNSFSLETGEVCISSSGGASIVLKNDGSVVVNNHLIITKEGDFEYEL